MGSEMCIRDSVLDGQRDLVDAQISHSQATFDFYNARYELAAALGNIADLKKSE